MRSKLTGIFTQLGMGNTVQVPDITQKEFEVIRTTLCRLNRLMREITEGQSVIASYEGGIGTFALGTPKVRGKEYTYIIIEPEVKDNGAEIRDIVETLGGERGSNSDLP